MRIILTAVFRQSRGMAAMEYAMIAILMGGASLGIGEYIVGNIADLLNACANALAGL